MTDDEFLEHRRKDLEASVEYFRSLYKPQREMWVVSQLAGNLGISTAGSDIKPVPRDPPDVFFKDANFEVKEIMDSGRRRHAEYKRALARARVAMNAQELIEHYTPPRGNDSARSQQFDRSRGRTVGEALWFEHLPEP